MRWKLTAGIAAGLAWVGYCASELRRIDPADAWRAANRLHAERERYRAHG